MAHRPCRVRYGMSWSVAESFQMPGIVLFGLPPPPSHPSCRDSRIAVGVATRGSEDVKSCLFGAVAGVHFVRLVIRNVLAVSLGLASAGMWRLMPTGKRSSSTIRALVPFQPGSLPADVSVP